MNSIKPMMKVRLSFLAGTGLHKMDIPMEEADFEFIYGIGSGGLTPFEYELAELNTGEDISLHLRSTEAQRFFEHLYPPVRELLLDRPDLFTTVRVVDVGPAKSPEVIKAMAEMTARGEGGGCGGGCGCGCG